MSDYVGEKFDINELYKQQFGYVGLPFPAAGDIGEQIKPNSPFGVADAVAGQYKNNLLGIPMVMPLEIGLPNEELLQLATEPMIGVKLKKRLIRRFPNRSDKSGSIKETWSHDDYEIEIKGMVVSYVEDIFPEEEVRKLRNLLEENKNLIVKNELLRIFGIERIAVSDFSFPFTPGLKNQAYTIKAYSDKLFDGLLIEA